MNEHNTREANVMIVDDNPANLKLLEDILGERRYEVRSFPRGRLAIAAASQTAPDLILLDINMPEMNGYEVCARLKENPDLANIPVIFLSALNATEDKIKGFRAGGVDYVSKPFRVEEVLARVETQVKLHRARQIEHELLENTLNGAVAGLWELLQLTSPHLAVRSQAIRDLVLWITRKLHLSESWQYELAATLCLVGCITLPDDAFERGYRGEENSADEIEMFRKHPETGARLVSKIPRLEGVAEMIRYQHEPMQVPNELETIRTGAGMLRMALELDGKVSRGCGFRAELAHLKTKPVQFDPRMVDALGGYNPETAEFELRSLPIHDLRPGMILCEDVFSADGNLLILRRDTVLTETWLERLHNFAKSRRVAPIVSVRIQARTMLLKGFTRGAKEN